MLLFFVGAMGVDGKRDSETKKEGLDLPNQAIRVPKACQDFQCIGLAGSSQWWVGGQGSRLHRPFRHDHWLTPWAHAK